VPREERFLVELGGVAFRQKRFREAAEWLRRVLRMSPTHRYANDFLATIYFMQGNLEAALKYWNRIEKPRLSKMEVRPEPQVDPLLLDTAFTFGPGGTVELSELRTTEARIAGLGIFRNHAFRLDGRNDGEFDLTFASVERNGWGSNKWEALLSTFRGIFYQAIHPEYYNAFGRAVNAKSTIRWDAQKRRVQAEISSPLGRDSRYRYWFGVDSRDERWELRSVSASFGSLRLRRNAISGGISSFRTSRWLWSSGGELSSRNYGQVSGIIAEQPALQVTGLQLKHTLYVRRPLLHIPERRLESSLHFWSETGRLWAESSRLFERVQVSGRVRWIPGMTDDDYAVQGQLRGGSIFGQTPFDELFILGLERDNDLPMRAHIGTRNGRKGSAPMGRRYLLSNWEFDKNVYKGGLIAVKLSPFLDTGRITAAGSPLGSHEWLWDIGIQAKLNVLGIGFRFTYGRDLRSGNNAFYVSAPR
jgi:hypothetical protein